MCQQVGSPSNRFRLVNHLNWLKALTLKHSSQVDHELHMTNLSFMSDMAVSSQSSHTLCYTPLEHSGPSLLSK